MLIFPLCASASPRDTTSSQKNFVSHPPGELLQNAVARGKECAIYRVRFMSQHSSLRAAAGTTGAKRSVLKRFERVALLKTRGQWKAGDRVTGLRKTKPPE